MISMKNMSAAQWLASARRDSVRLIDGLAELRQEKSVRGRERSAITRVGGGLVSSAPAFSAGAPGAIASPAGIHLPMTQQQYTKGGLCGPQPWRDAPVRT
ncbi:hypothetical protein [Nonomuraea longicatena]|uniref:Uncharacterized protein n=1 Tax=Nonomuraea longicatena TaxID=83682 RepID=A0ABN1R166_9ACTN